jgi:hypothetical protein
MVFSSQYYVPGINDTTNNIDRLPLLANTEKRQVKARVALLGLRGFSILVEPVLGILDSYEYEYLRTEYGYSLRVSVLVRVRVHTRTCRGDSQQGMLSAPAS